MGVEAEPVVLSRAGLRFHGRERGRPSRVTVTRASGSFSHRTQQTALAARVTASVGLDILGASDVGGADANGRFVSFLVQGQWAQRLPWIDSTLLARVDLQVTDDALLGLEQFAMGGYTTVRGYRENTLVRDNGVIGSVELAVDLPKVARWLDLEAAPFVDVGRSWSSERPTVGPDFLLSVGAGLRAVVFERAELYAFWGQELENVTAPDDDPLQNRGFHLGLRIFTN